MGIRELSRNAIARGLSSCRPDDVVLISDIDEIINPLAILKNKDKPGIKFFRQKLYYCFLNCECVGNVWDKPKMVFYKDLHSPQWLREYPNLPFSNKYMMKLAKLSRDVKQVLGSKDLFIEDGGWHFSYLGGIERVKLKIKSFAHEEFDQEHYFQTENLLNAIENGEDLFGREGLRFEFLLIDNSFPRFLFENQELYSSMIYNTGGSGPKMSGF